MVNYENSVYATDNSFSRNALDLALYYLYQLYYISFLAFFIKGYALTFGKMCLMMILKVTKKQGFTLPLEDTFFQKPVSVSN